jgi:hypothetical protein
VKRQLADLAKRMEEHELAVWVRCVDAVSALPGNPLGAAIDRSGQFPLLALGAVDRGDFNRVVALGVAVPVAPEDLDAICCFYDSHQQRHFRIEVTPLARPPELTGWITQRGLACDGLGTFKMWRRTESPPPLPSDIEVRRLGPADVDALAAVNIAAWGAWSLPVPMEAWFGATVGSAGVRHYGVFDGDRLVATGALFIGDRLGWLGFDATHPRYRGRKLRQAISSVRMVDAAAVGCEVVHAESAVRPSRRALDDGWQFVYEKQNYSSTPVNAAVAAPGTPAPPDQRVHDAPPDRS